MLYVYVETDELADVHSVCIGTEEFDETPFIVWQGRDGTTANTQAQVLANKLREGGATVRLH